jgi:hypothetical protein
MKSKFYILAHLKSISIYVFIFKLEKWYMTVILKTEIKTIKQANKYHSDKNKNKSYIILD